MKKIDSLLIKSFIGPFLVTFCIALFVLIMQTLWVYIDDIIGKGVNLFILIELISYLSISLFPMALPIAVLISSVMVMGNMAERYELTSFKSAGVSLLRIMQPLVVVAGLIALFAFLCANYLIPITNLQFKSRLYDIRKSKPTLSLEAGVFNDDFQGFTIYLKKKDEDGRHIEGVLIYDQSAPDGKLNQIAAQRGEMYTTEDGRFFVMNLFEGTQSQEINQRHERGKRNYAFVRTNFKEYTKVFDLREFSLKETDIDLFKTHHTMLNISQLQVAADSIADKMDTRHQKLNKHFIQFMHFEKQRDTILFPKRAPVKKRKPTPKTVGTLPDSIINQSPSASKEKGTSKQEENSDQQKETKKKKVVTSPQKRTSPSRPTIANKRFSSKNLIPQSLDKDVSAYDSFIETFTPTQQRKVYPKAMATIRSIKSQAAGTVVSLNREGERRVKHIFEKHRKYAMSLVIVIFLFIGASMGAIVRKGGFGYPILVSILFFVLYIIMMIAFEKLAEGFVIQAWLGAWLPCFLLAPLSFFLTYKAMNDAKLVNLNRLTSFFTSLGKWILQRQKAES